MSQIQRRHLPMHSLRATAAFAIACDCLRLVLSLWIGCASYAQIPFVDSSFEGLCKTSSINTMHAAYFNTTRSIHSK